MEAGGDHGHLDYYKALHRELVESGELVESEVLAPPGLAKIATSDGATAPVVTDGPFQEFKEWLAGYQIVDVVHRTELSAEAIRLTRMVQQMLPDHAEVAGLLALMLLIDARRPARTTPAGELIPLAEQDRTLWDQGLIAEGVALLDRAVGRGAPGEYRLQAAIAAVHDRTPRAEDTDWPQILALYRLLESLTGNPVVTLNRAVAAAMVDGPSAGLAVLDTVDERLNGQYRVDASARNCWSETVEP